MAEATTATTIIPLKIGIDFGGVLSIYDKHCNRSDEDEHQSIEINMPNAIESLIKFKDIGHQLYLISYCGDRRAIETKRSILRTLPRKDLFNELYFVQRTSHKADVCRLLGCDIMIDDKLKILNNIQRIIPTMKLIWFSSSDIYHSPEMLKVNSWCDLIKIIDEVLIYQAIRHKRNPRVSLDDKIHKI
jgi:hypothetical protein